MEGKRGSECLLKPVSNIDFNPELVRQIQETPYLQYFIGLPKYTEEPPFDPSTMVWFRKRLPIDQLAAINEQIIAFNQRRLAANSDQAKGSEHPKADRPDAANPQGLPNRGTLTLDATCAPANVAYPQDINLLNQTRQHCEKLIDAFYKTGALMRRPRIYCQKAHKDYLACARTKRRSNKKRRRAIRKQLQYIRRDRKIIHQWSLKGPS